MSSAPAPALEPSSERVVVRICVVKSVVRVVDSV